MFRLPKEGKTPITLGTEEPVISLGGYNGVDPVFTTDDLTKLVNEGTVRFFLVPDREPMAERACDGNASPKVSDLRKGRRSLGRTRALYDCRARGL